MFFIRANVIGHQTISPCFVLRFRRLFGQKIAIDFLIVILEEDRLPAVAALCDAMRQVRND
jgi:hypothetical protein